MIKPRPQGAAFLLTSSRLKDQDFLSGGTQAASRRDLRFGGELSFPVGDAGRVPARRMLRAAFVSAFITDPQPEHSYTAWLLRWVFSLSPQHEQVVLVWCGLTFRSSPPAAISL